MVVIVSFYFLLSYLSLSIQSLFDSADVNKNGSINRTELKGLLEKANYKFSDSQIELLYKYDTVVERHGRGKKVGRVEIWRERRKERHGRAVNCAHYVCFCYFYFILGCVTKMTVVFLSYLISLL